MFEIARAQGKQCAADICPRPQAGSRHVPLARAAHSFAVTLCALRARKAEPSAAANPARAVGPAAGNFFLTDWLAAAAVAAASEVGGQLRQDGIATARAAALARRFGAARWTRPLAPPEILEPGRRKLGVSHRVLNIEYQHPP